MYLNKKQQQRLSRTLSVSAVVLLYSFSTKDQVSIIKKYHNHTLQTKTRPDIIIHVYFIKHRDQFQNERKNMYVLFSIFCPRCCRTARQLFLLPVVLRRHTTNGSILLIGDVAYDARFSVHFEVQSQDIIIRHFVTSPFKSMCFTIFWQKLLSQNNRSYNREKSTE